MGNGLLLRLRCPAGGYSDMATPMQSPSPGAAMMLGDLPEDSSPSYSTAGTPVTGRSTSSNASNWGR